MLWLERDEPSQLRGFDFSAERSLASLQRLRHTERDIVD